MVYIIPLLLPPMGIIPYKLHESLKLLNLHPGLYVLMPEAVKLNPCHIVRKLGAEQ